MAKAHYGIYLKKDEASIAKYEEDCALDFFKKHINEALLVDKKARVIAGYLALTDGFETMHVNRDCVEYKELHEEVDPKMFKQMRTY